MFNLCLIELRNGDEIGKHLVTCNPNNSLHEMVPKCWNKESDFPQTLLVTVVPKALPHPVHLG